MNCMQKIPGLLISLLLGMAGLWPTVALAITINDAVQSAIHNNPDVLSKLHAFRSATESVNVGRADYLPTVDLSYESSRQKFDYPDSPGAPASQHYTTKGWTVSLTQSVFQGLQTWYQVKQLGYQQVVKYFEFLDSSENIALQTLQAYEQVMLYRELVRIAKDNYSVHKGIIQQIAQRVQAGVGRRVDLEQAAGRLAQAETNLITDNTNLQDATARFTRLTGFAPPEDLQEIVEIDSSLPAADQVMHTALSHSPVWLAAIANRRAAQATVNQRRGAFSPKVDLQLSQAPTNNYNGYSGRTNQSSAAVIFSLNLFRGGADRARLLAAAEDRNNAADLQNKVCYDLRQNLQLAYDNLLKYKAQQNSILQHQLSTEKALGAYRKQFDIGQRSLLDVLDSENELFQARRDYTNAKIQYIISQATVLSTAGGLLAALKLKPLDDGPKHDLLGQQDIKSCDSNLQTPTTLDVNTIPARQFNTPDNAEARPALDAPPAVPAATPAATPEQPPAASKKRKAPVVITQAQ